MFSVATSVRSDNLTFRLWSFFIHISAETDVSLTCLQNAQELNVLCKYSESVASVQCWGKPAQMLQNSQKHLKKLNVLFEYALKINIRIDFLGHKVLRFILLQAPSMF